MNWILSLSSLSMSLSKLQKFGIAANYGKRNKQLFELQGHASALPAKKPKVGSAKDAMTSFPRANYAAAK